MSELKLNLGAGGNILPGFENHDAEIDITKPLPWGDDTVDFILIEHCLEHVSGPDALRFLDEAKRILKPGGILRVCMPVLDNLKREHGRDIVLGHGHLVPYSRDSMERLIWLCGFKDYYHSERKECDGHHLAIGVEKDDIETCRIECVK